MSAWVAPFAVIAALTATACSAPTVAMDPAVNANDPACAETIVRLPDVVADLDRRRTNAQSTGAWGSPESVLLYCGIEPSGPTTDSCVNLNGIDWIIDRSNEPLYRFEAYGRNPGLQVIVDSEQVSGTAALMDLTLAVSMLPQERQCVALTDTLELE